MIDGAIGINWQLLWIEDEFQSGQDFWILNILTVRSRDMDMSTTLETYQYNMINTFVPCSSLLVIGCCLLNTLSSPGCMSHHESLKSWTKSDEDMPWIINSVKVYIYSFKTMRLAIRVAQLHAQILSTSGKH